MQQGGGSLRWLKRLFSTQKQLSLPASVYELLQSAPVQVQKVSTLLLLQMQQRRVTLGPSETLQ